MMLVLLWEIVDIDKWLSKYSWVKRGSLKVYIFSMFLKHQNECRCIKKKKAKMNNKKLD